MEAETSGHWLLENTKAGEKVTEAVRKFKSEMY